MNVVTTGKLISLTMLLWTIGFITNESIAQGNKETALAVKNKKSEVHNRVKTIGDMEFVYIQGGKFLMGSKLSPKEVTDRCWINELGPDSYQHEHPRHLVEVSGFWIGKYPVTQGQYESLMARNPSHFKGDPLMPVNAVNWYDAKDYCSKFNSKYGVKSRLPYEAEREYATRAGSDTEFYWGDIFYNSNSEEDRAIVDRLSWNFINYKQTLHPVGQKLPNAWGLYDLFGQINEWCEDWYDSNYYSRSPMKNPHGPENGKQRVSRGGPSSWGTSFRSAWRTSNEPHYRFATYGFRIVIPAP